MKADLYKANKKIGMTEVPSELETDAIVFDGRVFILAGWIADDHAAFDEVNVYHIKEIKEVNHDQ